MPSGSGVKIFSKPDEFGNNHMYALFAGCGVSGGVELMRFRGILRSQLSTYATFNSSAEVFAVSTISGSASFDTVDYSTTYRSFSRRVISATAANNTVGANLTGLQTLFISTNADGSGGFRYKLRFAPATGLAETNSLFAGLVGTSGVAGMTLSTLTDCLGVGYDSLSPTFSIYYNDAVGIPPYTIDTGISRPTVDRTRDFGLLIHSLPNGGGARVKLTFYEVGGSSFAFTAGTVPGPAVALYNRVQLMSGDPASTSNGISIVGCAVEMHDLNFI
jgi:hypothetical protein